LAHIGIAVFSIGLILNVTQSYSTEYIVKENNSIEFGGKTYKVNNAYDVSRDEKNVINLPITSDTKNKNASLNIFKNSSQQAISSPAIFRNIEFDTYVTIKFIDNENFKLIFRRNYGILIMWIGLALSTMSFIPKIVKNEK
jgi:cytochrome c biogenesis factor